MSIGAVVIGRNEANRLPNCLTALSLTRIPILYVDSGSTDNSVTVAGCYNVTIVELDKNRPFSAARARNEGAYRLLTDNPQLNFVQFVDGDCTIHPNWIEAALQAFKHHPETAILCGHLREKHPQQSIYNLLCDIEWRGPVGSIAATGGNFAIRASVFNDIGGFDDRVIAAEDDELCVRVRKLGWSIERIDSPMAEHDAAMFHFGQWWTRCVRAGHAFAQISTIHPEHFRGKQFKTIVWAVILPGLTIALIPYTSGWSLCLLALYVLSFARSFLKLLRQKLTPREAAVYSVFLSISKLPESMGITKFWVRYLFKRGFPLIEHK